MKHLSVLFALFCVQTVSAELVHINGILVDRVDNCDPLDTTSCGDGHCCVKEGIMYIPEATGPKPAYRISCKPLGSVNSFCSTLDTQEMCPCGSGLTCRVSFGSFGHCHH